MHFSVFDIKIEKLDLWRFVLHTSFNNTGIHIFFIIHPEVLCCAATIIRRRADATMHNPTTSLRLLKRFDSYKSFVSHVLTFNKLDLCDRIDHRWEKRSSMLSVNSRMADNRSLQNFHLKTHHVKQRARQRITVWKQWQKIPIRKYGASEQHYWPNFQIKKTMTNACHKRATNKTTSPP